MSIAMDLSYRQGSEDGEPCATEVNSAVDGEERVVTHSALGRALAVKGVVMRSPGQLERRSGPYNSVQSYVIL
jgi:hypothetical protein